MKHSLMLLRDNVERNTRVLLKRIDKCDTLEELVRVAFKDKEEVFQISFETYCKTKLPSIIRSYEEGMLFGKRITSQLIRNIRVSPYQAYMEYFTAIQEFYLGAIVRGTDLRRITSLEELEEEAFETKRTILDSLFVMLQTAMER